MEAELSKMTFVAERGVTGLWYVTSPDHKGLLIAERSLSCALSRAPDALEELLSVERAIEAK